MLNVFRKESTDELYVQLPDGRLMPLKDILKDYESILKDRNSEKAITSETMEKTSETKLIPELEVGKWFRIDREVIDKNKEEIHRKCNEAGPKGKELWERFKESNKIADENLDQYPCLIETYIFPREWEYKTEQEMRYMCEAIGDEMCDEVICDLELQTRICNGEPVVDLVRRVDKLPYVRIIKFRDGDTGYFGGGVDHNYNSTPASCSRYDFYPNNEDYVGTPYAFRKVPLQD